MHFELIHRQYLWVSGDSLQKQRDISFIEHFILIIADKAKHIFYIKYICKHIIKNPCIYLNHGSIHILTSFLDKRTYID